MSAETKITTREAGSKIIIDIDAQNVDFRNCEMIKSTVSALAIPGKAHLVLNLSQVGFMDSSGLGVILFCKRVCDEAGGSFAVCGLQSYVNNLVTLTKLDKAVSIFPTEFEAAC